MALVEGTGSESTNAIAQQSNSAIASRSEGGVLAEEEDAWAPEALCQQVMETFFVFFFVALTTTFGFVGPGPSKNASEKMPLRSFCRYFRAEISHGEPDRARDNFQKMLLFLQKHDFNIFQRNRSFIRPPSLEPRPKMTANGLSSYQLFVKNVTFPRQKLKCPSVFDIFRKEHVRFYENVIF